MTIAHPVARRQGGFTLVELMVVVSIIGLLAAVAMPIYTRSMLRSRTAERSTILDAVGRGMNDVVANAQQLPTVPAAVWAGGANPPGVPTTIKRKFDYSVAGWLYMPVVVQGDSYYSYSFVVLDPGGRGANLTATATAVGDLDGDGAVSTKTYNYVAEGYTMRKDGANPETPRVGEEDMVTFGTF